MRKLILYLVFLAVLCFSGSAVDANSTDLNHASALKAFNQGLEYDSLGQISNASAAYRRAVGLDPEFAEAWYNLGLCLYAVSDKFNTFDQAYDCFMKASSLNPALDPQGDGVIPPIKVNSKEDWDYWKQLHALPS